MTRSLRLHLELIQGYANDAWFAHDANLQDMQKNEEVWKSDHIGVPAVCHIRSARLWDYHALLAGHSLQRSL